MTWYSLTRVQEERQHDDNAAAKGGGSGGFRMPLHYPRYTRKQYEDMDDLQLDNLLADYGLEFKGGLAQKRMYAIDAFLWPDLKQLYDQVDHHKEQQQQHFVTVLWQLLWKNTVVKTISNLVQKSLEY